MKTVISDIFAFHSSVLGVQQLRIRRPSQICLPRSVQVLCALCTQ